MLEETWQDIAGVRMRNNRFVASSSSAVMQPAGKVVYVMLGYDRNRRWSRQDMTETGHA